MKKMKSTLIIGTLIAALGASTVFAATSASTSDYDQNPHKMRDLVQQSMQEKNAGNESAGKIQYPGQNRGPGMGGCNKQGQMHKGPGMMREQGAKILADLTGRDVESIKEDARTNHKPIREMAKDAGVYDQFMAKHLELAKEHMNKAVADGKMTQEQADKMLQNMKDGKHFGPKDGMHKHMMQGPRNGDCQNND